jgi:hypothetical protein
MIPGVHERKMNYLKKKKKKKKTQCGVLWMMMDDDVLFTSIIMHIGPNEVHPSKSTNKCFIN